VGQVQGRAAWRRAYERLTARQRSSLSAADLDTLAEALFWLDRPEASIVARREAYAAHLDDGDLTAAAMAAWQLYFDHALVGAMAVAGGWLTRARGHAGPPDGTVVDGFLAVAEADRADQSGDLAAALDHTRRAVGIGRATGHRDLLAMALQARGRLLVAHDEVAAGLALLDEAMVGVISGELTPLFTGWVYCSALATCRDVADLRRAAEWTDAALRWCEELEAGSLYPGLCRVHRVELACLQGDWTQAAREVDRACRELLAHDARYAGDAFYLAAEVQRLRGDLDAAEETYQRAHGLGRDPQPGLAWVWLARGRPAAAVAALRLALEPGPSAPLARCGILAALAEAEIAVGELERAGGAVAALAALARRCDSRYLDAVVASTTGLLRLEQHDAGAAVVELRRAKGLLSDLAMPYEAARAQLALARATRAAGDDATGDLELRAALSTFERLGARQYVTRVRDLLQGAPAPGPLTPREIQVLRLVAEGRTNRQIAATLVISQHTVGRHLSNIYTKLGVGSRSAATAYAYEHGLAP
jgi:DNA-binding NarL/FixJ family response regulator